MVEDLNTLLNNLVALRKENKNTTSLLTELNNYAIKLNNEDKKITILKSLYKKKDKNNKTFFDYYYLRFLTLVNLSYMEIDLLLKEELSLSMQKYLFSLLKNEEKISYLIQSQKLNSNLINEEIKEGNKRLIRVLLSDLSIINKLEDNSLELTINIFKKYIDITKLSIPLINKITSTSLTNYLNYQFNKVSDLINLIDKNKSLISYLPNQCLTLNIKDKDVLLALLKKEINILPKLDGALIIKYLEFTNLDNLTHYENINTETLFFINELKVIFNKSANYDYIYFINNSEKHSLIIYPFYADKYAQFANIIHDYKYLNKFSYEIIELVINSYYTFDEKVALFRNEEIISDLPSTTLTNILNTLNLRTVLNLIQNKHLLAKIEGLNCVVEDLDKSLLDILLSDPDIVDKACEELIFTTLNMLKESNIKKYLNYPYIKNKLTLHSFLILASKCHIKISDLITNYDIKTNLNIWIKEYITNVFKDKPDFNFINSLEDMALIFNIDNNLLNKIDLNELKYLYEMITTKSNLKQGKVTITYEHLESLIKCYLLLGFQDTVKLINTGSTLITFEDIIKVKKDCKKNKLTNYKINNELVFANLPKRLAANLDDMSVMFNGDTTNLEFSTLIYSYPLMKNIIRLMEQEGYSKINDTLNTLERYLSYKLVNPLLANEILQNFCDNFIAYLLEKESKHLDKVILGKLDNTLLITKDAYKNYIKTSKEEFLNIYHFKLFTYLLGNKLDSKDISLFKKDIDKILEEYHHKVTENLPKLFSNNSLISLFTKYYKNKLDIPSFLKEIGVYMPLGYLEEQQMQEEKLLVKKINSYIINTFDSTEARIKAMNDILYHSYSYNYPPAMMKKIKSFQNNLEHLLGSIYFDKSSMMLVYEKGVILGEEKEIKDYAKIIKLVEKLISNTKSFISNIFNDEKLLARYSDDFNSYKKQTKQSYELNKKNFYVNQNSFDLDNLLNIFRDVNLKEVKIDEDIKEFLFAKKNIYLAGLGLDELYNISFGSILNNMEAIKGIYKESNTPIKEIELSDAAMLSLYLDSKDNNIDILDKDYYHELYKQAYSIRSSIPYVSRIYNNIAYQVLDKQSIKLNQDNKDFILDANTCVIKITDTITKEELATIYGFRKGNSLVIDVSDISNEELLKTIDICGESILEVTRFVNGTEAIDYLILRGKNIPGGVRIKENNTLLYQDFMMTYPKDKLAINELYITKSYKEIKSQNFLDYEPIHPYFRKRRKIKKLNNTVSKEELEPAKRILKLYALEKHLSYSNLEKQLKDFDYLIVGDDWLIILAKKELLLYVVGDDERKEAEINSYLLKLGRDDLYVRNNYRLYR